MAIEKYVEQQMQRISIGNVKLEIKSANADRIKQQVAAEPQVLAWILAARAVLNTDEAIVKP